MATTYIPFLPQQNTSPPFQTQITLDNATYTLICWWNLYAGWWYYTINDQSGAPVYTGYLSGSPLTANIYLAPGIFSTSTLLYREDTNNFEVTS